MTDLPKIVGERLKTGVAGPHPDPDLLAAFAEQTLPDRERNLVLGHLSRCGECRDVVGFATPAIESAALGDRDTARLPKAPWFAWPVLRWGALAACVVIVGTAALMQRTTMYRAGTVASVSDAGPAKVSVDAIHHQEVAPALGDTIGFTDQREESKRNSLAKAKGVTRQDEGAQQRFAALSKNLAEPDKADELLAAVSPAEHQQTSVGAAPPAASAPPEIPQAEARSLPLQGRDMAGVAVLSSPKPATQTVAIDATAPRVAARKGVADKDEAVGKAKAAGAQYSVAGGLAASSANEDTVVRENSAGKLRSEVYRFTAELSRWTISSDGQLQHSVDSGRTWQPVSVAERATFRALSANGPDVWVGGTAGLLYHSSDAGGHWTQVKPTAGHSQLTDDIAAIEFTDPLHGKLTTAKGEAWRTVDAGQTWDKQP
jgi:Photosynthesis system II assembly factor YCF48